jgi:hypothetical protein
MTVPSKTISRDVFLSLFTTIALYAIAVSMISLLFQYVDVIFPDPLSWRGNSNQALRTVLSILIIVAPVYVWTMRFINKTIADNKENHRVGIRRWLTHLTLFVSGVTIIIDLVTLLYNFLGGDLTGQFAMKIIAVLLVATAVFTYYIWDLRRETEKVPTNMIWLARVSLALIAISVIGAFFIMESPKDQRARKLDDQRVNDLWTVQSAVENYWWQTEKLPESLDNLSDDFVLPIDPENGTVYEYRLIDEDSYELCAEFLFATDSNYSYRGAPYPTPRAERDFYNHKSGRDCFERSISRLVPDVK